MPHLRRCLLCQRPFRLVEKIKAGIGKVVEKFKVAVEGGFDAVINNALASRFITVVPFRLDGQRERGRRRLTAIKQQITEFAKEAAEGPSIGVVETGDVLDVVIDCDRPELESDELVRCILEFEFRFARRITPLAFARISDRVR